MTQVLSPRGEILATLRYRRIQIAENVDVDGVYRIFFFRTRDKVDTAERLKLGKLEHSNRRRQREGHLQCLHPRIR